MSINKILEKEVTDVDIIIKEKYKFVVISTNRKVKII